MGLKIIKRLLSAEVLSAVGFSPIRARAGQAELSALLQIPVQRKRTALEHLISVSERTGLCSVDMRPAWYQIWVCASNAEVVHVINPG